MASPSEQGPPTDQPDPPSSYWEVGGPWQRSSPDPGRDEPRRGPNDPVDVVLATLRAEIHEGAERVSQEIGHLRYQLAGVLKDAAALTNEHQIFRQQLTAQQRDMVDRIVAPVLAERDATMGRLHAEHDRLGAQLTAILQAEIAGMADAQEIVRQSLVGEIAKHTDAQTLFEQALGDALTRHAEAQKLAQQGLVNQMTKHAEALKLAELSLVQQVASLADAQSRYEEALSAEIAKQTDAHKRLEQSLVDKVATLTTEQAQFQQALQGRQTDLVDKVVAAALAQRDVTVGRVGEKNESLRRQLRGDLREEASQIGQRLIRELSDLVRDEIAKLVAGQQQLADQQQHLADRQADGPAQVEAVMPASIDATLSLIWDETQRLRDQIGGSLLDRIETVADEQRQFRTRIATAAGVAESRFASFSQAMNARLDRLEPSGQAAPAAAGPEPRFDELVRAVASVVDRQQKTDALLAAIQEQLVRLEQQKATGPVQLDDSQFATLRKAVAPTPAKEPKANPARPARKPAAVKKRTRPPSS